MRKAKRSGREPMAGDRGNPEKLRQLRWKLARSDRRLRREAAATQTRSAALRTFSHELREPLNGVVGMAQLLSDTRLDPEQRSYVDAIRGSAESLATLVNDLLDIARLDAGGVGLTEAEFSPGHLLESLTAIFAPRAAAKGLAFGLELAPSLPEMLRGDPGRLRQILVNLLGNALKFTDSGKVDISVDGELVEDESFELRVVVSDTGPGMEPGTFERLTSPFAQATPEIARLYGGSGLGLVIARRLLEAMRGGLRCSSVPGRGSRFEARCRLLLPQARGFNPTGPAPLPPGSNLAGASLLIVDPQDRTRIAMRDLAILWGMEVRAAKSAREARLLLKDAVVRSRPFDLVIVDNLLPDLAPAEFASRLRADPALAGARLVLQTQAGLRGDAGRARGAGFAAYLPKPVEPDLLRACLQRLLTDAAGDLLTVHRLMEARRALEVLIVDDNPVNCRLAAIMLERAGHRVTVSESGSEAIERVGEKPFDVVLMDVQMPGMDGLEATRRIRSLPDAAAAAVPIVAVTANAMQGDDALCFAAGMNGYVTKPIDGAGLVATVERVAAASR
jgi:CheY-like chemotaxis protein